MTNLQPGDDVSFTVGDGETVALMGENGAGKSTLFDILATLDRHFEGEAVVGGMDVRQNPAAARARIGYVPGRFSLYGDLSVQENLDFFAMAYSCDPSGIEHLSPYLWKSLENFRDYRADALSGGMKQKLAICCAMVHNPSVLLLDEPTVGVDPVSRAEMWKEVAELRKTGVSVLVSTHYLDEAAAADRILFLHEGRRLLFGTPSEILRSYRHSLYSMACPVTELPAVRNALGERSGVIDVYLQGEMLNIIADDSFVPDPVLGRSLKAVEPGIEDIFIDTLSRL